MQALLTLLFSALSNVPGMVGDYFKKKQELQQLELQNQQALLMKQQEAIMNMQISDNNRAIQSLKASGQWFKYCVFWMIASPFVSCLINRPEYAVMVFNNLGMLPEWYLIIFTGLVATIWGIPVQGNIMQFVWEGIKQGVANRREYKLAKIDRKAYYVALKNQNGNRPIPQDFVDRQEKIFDEMEAGK